MENVMNQLHVRRISRTATITLAAAGVLASTMPAAQATPTRDREGTTRVAVAPAVVWKLDRLGLEAAPTKNSTAVPFRGTVAFRFPITAVERDGNIIRHAGGVRVSSSRDSIALKRFTIKLRTGKVSAVVLVNGDRVARTDVFNIRPSGRPALGDVRLTLTHVAARAIDSTFGAPAFQANDTFGFATVKLG
jgi:hypothetical protein